MKKDAYYFPHDSNATNDPKILILLSELGLEGYGIYWVIIEHLRDQPEYASKLNVLKGLAMRYNTSHEKFLTVVKSYGLFILEDDQFFYSISLIERMLKWESKRRAAREAGIASGQARRLNRAGLEQSLNERSTDVEQREERKGEKKKRDDKKKEEKRALTQTEKRVIIFPFDSIDFKSTWENWKEYKSKEFNFQYKSAQSEQAALSKLNVLSGFNDITAQKIVIQSMSNGWKGFFELKNNKNDKNGNRIYSDDFYRKHIRGVQS